MAMVSLYMLLNVSLPHGYYLNQGGIHNINAGWDGTAGEPGPLLTVQPCYNNKYSDSTEYRKILHGWHFINGEYFSESSS